MRKLGDRMNAVMSVIALEFIEAILEMLTWKGCGGKGLLENAGKNGIVTRTLPVQSVI